METKLHDQLKAKLDRARLWVLRELPFYGALLFYLADELCESVNVAATNGKEIRWNPQRLAEMPEPELRFVLVHELKHVTDGHLWRLPRTRLGNEAADYAVNGTLVALTSAQFSMPQGGLLDLARFDPAKLSEEEILDILEREQAAEPEGGSEGAPKNPCGEFEEPAEGEGTTTREPAKHGRANSTDQDPTATDSDGVAPPESLKHEWEKRVVQAVLAEQAAGRGEAASNAAEATLRRIKARCRLDWRAETADWLRTATTNTRADWSRPARRHAWQPVLIASRRADAVGDVVAIRDTSGSTGVEVVSEFNSILESISSELGCRVRVIDADTDIRADWGWIDPGCPMPGKAAGGGGTHFGPALRLARDIVAGGGIAGVVFLTDGYGGGTELTVPDVGAPLLWVSNGVALATGRTVMVRG